ncbi:MAG: T9SS type A sorting domain-containing protein [Saprospiraceae bacterium]|nr:T9SS type A sorting domain-containing protein [Saprospiraceae bacterium]
MRRLLMCRWYDPFNQLFSTATNPTVSIPGTYLLEVTDANGCVSGVYVDVLEDTAVPQIVVNINTPLGCAGQPAIVVALPPNEPNYQYYWSNGAAGSTVTLQWPGSYCVTVENINNGCIATECVNIVPPAPLFIDIPGTYTTDCPNEPVTIGPGLISGGTAPYTYFWADQFGANIGTTPNVIVFPGVYTIIVADANGCMGSATVEVQSTLLAEAGPGLVTINCPGEIITLDATGSSSGPDIVYEWTGPGGLLGNSPTIQASEPGTYLLRVFNQTLPDCEATDIVVVQPSPLENLIMVNMFSCTDYTLGVSNQNHPLLQSFWTYPDGHIENQYVIPANQSGWYYIDVFDPPSGCSLSDSIYLSIDPSSCTQLSGRVFEDLNANCADDAEVGLADWMVRFDNGQNVYHRVTDSNGFYGAELPIGNYEVSLLPPVALWDFCQAIYSVALLQPGESQVLDIPATPVESCASLTVDISTPLLRRCFNNYYYVNYCNEGTETAPNSYVEITIDPFFSYFYSSIPLAGIQGNVLRFDLGDLAPGQCGAFTVVLSLSCSAVLGQTHCVEAHIYPDEPCDDPDPLWSGASLAVNATCAGNEVQFRITNVGSSDMSSASNFIVVEDGVMLMSLPDTVLLESGEFYELTLPANGATYRVEVEQTPYHPGESAPSATVEGCGTNQGGVFSTGFVNQFSLDDADPFIDVDCRENVGSWDPNDKQGYPTGYGSGFYIEANTDLEYLIRFQNTGTDTAFRVVIRDTLSPFLDLTTVRPSVASHAYTWDIEGERTLVFTLDPIILPDSTTNFDASQGFIRFRVDQLPDLPIGTQIQNKAGIYFDFNEPVITNTTVHQIGEDFVTSTGMPEFPLPVVVFPNPAGEYVYFQIDDAISGGRLEWYGISGQLLWARSFEGRQVKVDCGNMAPGMYQYRISAGGRMGRGKVVVR